MTTIHAQVLGEQAVLPRSELLRLVELARKCDAVELECHAVEVAAQDILRMAEEGKAFDFWRQEGEALGRLGPTLQTEADRLLATVVGL